MLTHSEELNELAAALSKAQAVMKGAPKDAQNPAYKSKFASLSSVWEACRGPLTDHGLSVIQMPGGSAEVVTADGEVVADGRSVTVTTMLLHASGQWIKQTLTMTARDASPQSLGSVITYARRYGLQAAVGICPEDDDGHAASHPGDAYASPQHGHKPLGPADPPRPPRPHVNGASGEQRQYDGPPKSGKALFAWVKSQEQRFDFPDLLKHLNAWSKSMGYPGKMTEYDPGQVAQTHQAALEILRSNRSDEELDDVLPDGRMPGDEG